MLYQRETLKYCIWLREYSTYTPTRLNILGNSYQKPCLTGWLLTMGCRVRWMMIVQLESLVTWFGDPVWSRMISSSRFEWWMIEWLIDVGFLVFEMLCWNKTGKRKERRNFNFKNRWFLSHVVLKKTLQNERLIARSPEPVPSEPAPIHGFCRYPWIFVHGMEHSLVLKLLPWSFGVEISLEFSSFSFRGEKHP